MTGYTVILVHYWLVPGGVPAGMTTPAISVVQSIPVGDFSIKPVAGSLPTWMALTLIANSSVRSLDFTAMYMDLLGTEDRKTYSPQQMKGFGADHGTTVYNATLAAASRGIAIRILLGTLNDPINSPEVKRLLSYKNVEARTWDPKKWYGGGIMHAKLWSSDGERAYLGSANADWKSLAQVKELGVLATHSEALSADIGKVFNIFWKWAALEPTNGSITQAFSDKYLAQLTLPAWDPAVPLQARIPSPFPVEPASLHPSSLLNPFQLGLAAEPGASGFVSASPGGALVSDRTPDEVRVPAFTRASFLVPSWVG